MAKHVVGECLCIRLSLLICAQVSKQMRRLPVGPASAKREGEAGKNGCGGSRAHRGMLLMHFLFGVLAGAVALHTVAWWLRRLNMFMSAHSSGGPC